MTDDEVLLQLATRVESSGAADERTLERFALGELSEEESLQVQRRAASDVEFARKLELYRPFDVGESKTFVDEAVRALGVGSAKRMQPRLRIALGGLAVAATLALILSVRSVLLPAGSQAALPTYGIEVERSQATDRKFQPNTGEIVAPGATLKWSAQSPLVVLLRPATTHGREVDIRVFVRSRDEDGHHGQWRSYVHRGQKAAGGSLRITLDVEPPWPHGTLGFGLFDASALPPSTLPAEALEPGHQFTLDYEWNERVAEPEGHSGVTGR